jgi:dTMP kinase
VTIVLAIDPANGLSRVTNHDRLESEPIEYHREVASAYVELANADPERYLVLDGTGDIEEIAKVIRERVAEELAKK